MNLCCKHRLAFSFAVQTIFVIFLSCQPASGQLVANQDGTLGDVATHLQWTATDEGTETWADAISTCKNLTAAGHDDWRLPNTRELLTLVDTGVKEPAADPLLNLATTSYWTATSTLPDASRAWSVNFQYGAESPAAKDSVLSIRCVRGGPDPAEGVNTSPFQVTGTTAYDSRTDLTWQKWDDDTSRNLAEALTYCEDLTLGGQTDWRLPNMRELLTLTETSWVNPAAQPILPMRPEAYWSGTSNQQTPAENWAVNFSYGNEESHDKAGSALWVRCVRGGPDKEDGAGTFRMVDNGDGIIVDRQTTLQWQKVVADTPTDWETGLAYCENLELAGRSDWRLPNERELTTITDTRYVNPASVSVFQSRADYYWSSTASHTAPSKVWAVKFAYGTEETLERNSLAYNRCVRGGPTREDTTGISLGSPLRDLKDGTVLDVFNRTLWQREYNPALYTWADAMQYCKDLDLNGHSWRLPNVRELNSLTNSRYQNPSSESLPASAADLYWSSTTFVLPDVAGDPPTTPPYPDAWTVNFLNGNGSASAKTTSHLVRCVTNAPPEMLTTPDLFVYGGTTFTQAPLGETSQPHRIIVGNIGTGPLSIGTPFIAGTYSGLFAIVNDTCAEQTIRAAGTCSFAVTYTPDSAKPRSAEIHIPSNDPDSPTTVITINGKDPLLPPEITIFPNRLDFQAVALGETSAVKQLVITNSGDQNLTLGSLSLDGPDAALFSVVSDNCSDQTIGASGQCQVTVQFAPDTDGLKHAALVVPSNLPLDSRIPLSGFGGSMGGTISGRLTDADGAGISGVQVYLYPDISSIHTPAQAIAGPVTTDSYGYYQFSSVAAGYYVVAPDQSGNLYYPQFTDPDDGTTSSFRQVELIDADVSIMETNFTTNQERPFIKILFPRSGDKLKGDFGIFGTAFRYIGNCSNCSNVEKLEVLLDGIPVLQGTLLGAKSDRFALSQVIWRTSNGMPVSTNYSWQDLFQNLAEGQWVSLQVRATNANGTEDISQVSWIGRASAAAGDVAITLDAQQPLPARTTPHTVSFTADSSLENPSWYTYQWDNSNHVEFDQRTALTTTIPYTMDVEDVWPVAVALRDGNGNTVVDIEQILSFKPARYGNPSTNGSGSRMAALGANVADGNFFYRTVDMTLEGIGIPFVLARSYNSLGVDAVSWMGKGGWAHNFDRAMFLSKSGRRLYVMQPDGHSERFGFVNGHWQTMTPGCYDVITEHYGATIGEFSYTLRDKSNTRYLYKWVPRADTGDWRLVSITDADNNTITLSYSPTDGYLSKIIDTRGRDILFSYYTDPASSDFGFLKQVTESFDQNPRSIAYQYDSEGRLETFIDRRGKAWRYTYETTGRLATIQDPDGHILVTNTYDPNSGWLATQKDGLDHTWDIAYNRDAQSGVLLDTTVTDPKGNWIKYILNQNTGMVDQVTNSRNEVSDPTYVNITDNNRTQDTSLIASSVNPRGYTSSYGYADTGSGNLTTLQNPANLTMQMSYQEDRTNQNLNLVKKVTMPGTTTPYSLDYYANSGANLKQVTNPEGATVQFSYNDKGQVTRTISPLGLYTYYTWTDNYLTKVTTEFWDAQNNLISYDTTYTYDGKGRPTTVTDPEGNTTQYSYNENDQVTAITYDLDPAVAGVDQKHFAYKDNGALAETIDLNGNRVTYDYNNAGLLQRVNYFTGGTGPLYTEISYDELLRRTTTTNFRRLATTSSYDDVTRLRSVSNPLGETVRTRQDENGNTIWIEWRDSANKVIKTMTFTYDQADRKKTSEVSMGMNPALVTSYTYDPQTGYLKTVTNPRGVVTEYAAYDKVGRPTLIKHDHLGHEVITRVSYDANGNPVTVTDPKGSVTHYTYDPLNRLIQREDDLGHIWSYTYDANGNRLTSTTPDQQTTTYSYGAYNRLKSITYPDGKSVAYAWDGNGNMTTMDDSSFKAGWLPTHHEYDALDRLTSRTDAFGQTVRYTYGDTTGINTIIYPDYAVSGDRTVTYVFNDADRLASVTDWLGNTTSYGYNGLGFVTSIAHSLNSSGVDITYDAAGRLTDYSNNLGGKEIAGYHYELDANGNRTSATIIQPLLPMVSAGNVAYGVPNSLNQISEMSGGTGFVYDDRGNLTSLTLDGQKRNFIYDGRDLLTYNWVTGDADDYFTYSYSGSGDRIETRQGTTNAAYTRYVLDVNNGLSKVLMRTDENNQPRDYFIYGAAGLVSRISADNKAYVYHYDPSGNTVALSDSTGTLVNSYAYTPYGQATTQETVDNPFRFVGQFGVMADPSGLSFMRARFYHPQLRRFLGQDKVWGNAGNSQSLNQYAYVQGNPIMLVDPSGYYSEKEWTMFTESNNFVFNSFSWAGTKTGHIGVEKVANGAGDTLAFLDVLRKTYNTVEKSKIDGDSDWETFMKGTIAFADNTLYATCGAFGTALAAETANPAAMSAAGYTFSMACESAVTTWRKKVVPFIEKNVIAPVGDKVVDAIRSHNKRIDRINNSIDKLIAPLGNSIVNLLK